VTIGLLTVPPTYAQTPTLGEQLKSASRAAGQSVVRLRVIGGQQQIDGESVNSLVTTGVVISESGEILTSSFALQGNPDAIFVERADGNRTAVNVIGTDHVRRLVLLRADGAGPWRAIPAASKSGVQVGQYAIALGQFYSVSSPNVSVGIVSALNRIHGRALQTDAKISPVNYGGPLINLSGEALGVLVPLSPRGRGTPGSGLEWYDSGIGFAIPMQDALESAGKLRSGTDLRPGLLGLRLEQTGAFSSQVIVAEVLRGGPADAAGLKSGDRILKMGERAIERPGMVEEYLLSRYAADEVSVLVQRGAEQMLLTAKLVAELPVPIPGYLGLLPVPQPPAAAGDGDLIQRMLKGIPGPRGQRGQNVPADAAATAAKASPVRVLIIPGSPAAASGLPESIDVMAVDEKPVESESQLRVRLRTPAADTPVKLRWRSPGSDQDQEIEIRAVGRSERVEQVAPALLTLLETTAAELAAKSEAKEIAGAEEGAPATAPEGAGLNAAATGLQRQEIEIPEKGRVILLRSGTSAALPVAPVVLLSAHGQSEERILDAWRVAIDRYRIVLVIPVNPEKSALTDADQSLVMAGLQAAAGRLNCDLRRAAAVAGKEQSALAFQLVADPASPLRGVSLTEGWIDDSLIEDGDSRGRSVLFATPSGNTTPQDRALRSRSIEQLRKAGFWVPDVDPAATFPDTTAAWTVWLRCL
jgi:serine protease Do